MLERVPEDVPVVAAARKPAGEERHRECPTLPALRKDRFIRCWRTSELAPAVRSPVGMPSMTSRFHAPPVRSSVCRDMHTAQ